MTVTFDGYHLVPKNQATANLFIYTPYVGYSPELEVTKPYGGNRLFWTIWNRYFTKKYYPDGFVIKYSSNYYLIENNQKRKFASRALFLQDYSESDAQAVSSDVFTAYANGPNIEFNKNTLVRHPTSGQIYLLTDYKTKRPIIDNNALAQLSDVNIAITASQIPAVNINQLTVYANGLPISTTSVYPQGKLFRTETGAIYLLQDGIKQLVDPIVWRIKYNSQTPQSISSGAIADYIESTMDRLPDGTFAKSSSGKYYLIAGGGERMRVQATAILSRVFGSDKLSSAVSISDELLEAHTAGETIEYIDDTLIDPPTPTSPSSSSTAPSGTYAASFVGIEPKIIELINDETKTLTVQFKNTGSATWQPGNVYLKVFDKGTDQTSFTQGQRFPMAESRINNGGIATFYPELSAPSTPGPHELLFKLYYDKAGIPTAITSGYIGKFVFVQSGETATILSNSFPIAVRNDWNTVDVELKLKNTSDDVTWISKNTKLKITNEDGSQSSFYDANDWIDETVAALPINSSSIAPGEEAVFKFTLKIRDVPPKVYGHKIILELTDLDKIVLLSGRSAWVRLMRVD